MNEITHTLDSSQVLDLFILVLEVSTLFDVIDVVSVLGVSRLFDVVDVVSVLGVFTLFDDVVVVVLGCSKLPSSSPPLPSSFLPPLFLSFRSLPSFSVLGCYYFLVYGILRCFYVISVQLYVVSLFFYFSCEVPVFLDTSFPCPFFLLRGFSN